jgi:hypothetical protein
MSANLNQMTNRIYNSQHGTFDRAYFNSVLSLGREFLLISAGQMVAVLGGVVGVRVLTGILDPTVYGQLALGMTLATLVLQVVGPLGGSFLRLFNPALEGGRLNALLKAGWLVLSWVSIFVMCLTILLFLGLLLLGYGHWMGLLAAAIAF